MEPVRNDIWKRNHESTPEPEGVPEILMSILRYAVILNEDLTISGFSSGMDRILNCRGENLTGKDFRGVIGTDETGLKESLEDVRVGKRRRASSVLTVPGHVPIPVEIISLSLEGGMKILVYTENSFDLVRALENERYERKERMKELRCLYLVAKEMERSRTLEELSLRVSEHITAALRFPDVCSTVITLDNREHVSHERVEPVIRTYDEPVFIRGEKKGGIRVRYHRDEQFLTEEIDLISSIAKLMGRAFERFELEKKRREYTESLEQIVAERVRELEHSRRRYKDLFDSAPSSISISTREGEVIAANSAFYRLFKVPAENGGNLHVIHDKLYCNPHDRETLLDMADKYGRVEGFETDLRAADGSIISVICCTTKLEEEGTVLYESIIKDITEKKHLEHELRRQNEILEDNIRKRTCVLERQKDKLLAINRQCKQTSAQLRSTVNRMQTLFNAITDPVILIGRDYSIQLTNQKKEYIGEKCHKVLFGRDEVCERCPAIRTMQQKKPFFVEVAVNNDWYQLQCYPLLDAAGEVEGVIEWIRDITREKNLCNSMLQADRLSSLGQLVSGVGHEINNPNTFILGNMKIIREAMNDILPVLDEHYRVNPDLKLARLKYPFFKEHISLLIDDMTTGAERIKTIVFDLKKFAGKSDDSFEDEVDINTVIERSLRLVRNQVERKASTGAKLTPNIPLIRANPIGLEQVIVNLLINAYDAIGEGDKGNISVSSTLDESGENVVITVADDGMGMDESTLRRIFDPFFTTKRNKGGTGLGLSIVFRIIKEHDGEIDIESTPGKGTTFFIKIPCRPGQDHTGSYTHEPGKTGAENQENPGGRYQ